MGRSTVFALALFVAIGCTPTASGPTPTASTSQPATSPTASPTQPPRIGDTSAPFPAVSGAILLFQAPSETRLRAISFGGEVTGLLQASVAQVTAGAGWSQSPYGVPYLVGSTAHDRDGKALGAIPWPATTAKRWSSDGRFLCAAVPASATSGAQMRLEMAFIGQPAKVIASGFTTFGNNAGYPVLACDEGTDRAIVAVFGQGVAPGRLWVFRLSNGSMIRSVDYSGPISDFGWVAASADGSMLAESSRTGGAGGPWKATIRSADNGAQLGTLDGFVIRGFSGDKSLVVGANDTSVAVIDWKTGRKVWSGPGPYGGFLAEPASQRLAVGVGFVGGSDQRDVYLVGPDGAAKLLYERVRVALLH